MSFIVEPVLVRELDFDCACAICTLNRAGLECSGTCLRNNGYNGHGQPSFVEGSVPADSLGFHLSWLPTTVRRTATFQSPSTAFDSK